MSSSSPSQQTPVSCKLVHHGAAASSSPHVLVWLPSLPPVRPDSQIVYASHGIVNICEKQTVAFGNNQKESVWSVSQTLRTSMPTADANKRVITSLAHVGGESLVCGFSNGSINLWSSDVSSGEWKELPIVVTETGRSITHVDGHYFDSSKRYILFTCSSEGTNMIQVSENSEPIVTQVSTHAARVINCQYMPAFDQVLVLIGTAAPRHNKIHVYLLDSNIKLHHMGSLTGHEDWITCLAWNSTQTTLASGSQDAKIRLWQFTTTTTTNSSSTDNDNMAIVSDNDDSDTSDDDENFDNDDDDEEGEARLELVHFNNKTTRVTLEALLFGHEEAVTAICWHPDPMPLYRQEEILISSSMDRTILIWSPVTGVWTPLTRVGSAGGILGGSIGSSLLGFVNVVVEPLHGTSLVGHAYGGALHVWNVQQDDDSLEEEESVEDVAMHCKWKAAPCITGHFEGVTDLCWEAERGDYLLTVSDDQTCRLWAPVSNEETEEQVWVELARPQVHGYDLTAVTSVSTPEHGHLYVSGADEKEARVFDAPLSSLRLLRAIYGDQLSVGGDGTSRVERAYIPSLGLSQKASAADRAEMDTNETDVVTIKEEESQLRLPLERDLGVVSLWPEVRKLFGHNTELFCLASTVSARSGPKFTSSPFARQVLVASSTKARDIDAAAIRLWDAEKGKCIQVLSGGHRSTVAALAFSPDGRYLVSCRKRADCIVVLSYF